MLLKCTEVPWEHADTESSPIQTQRSDKGHQIKQFFGFLELPDIKNWNTSPVNTVRHTEHLATKWCTFIVPTETDNAQSLLRSWGDMVNLSWTVGPSDAQLLVESAESVTHDVELVPELLHHAVDAGGVF